MASLLRVTERISCLIDDVLRKEDLPGTLQKELKNYQREDTDGRTDSISFDLLQKVFKHSTTKGMYLHEVLEGSELYFPPMTESERNPELVARLEKLKVEQENKQYREMTNNVNAEAFGNKSLLSGVGREVRNVRVQAQLMGVFNVVLTVGGAFTFGFMASYYSGKPAAYCVVVGFVFGLITAAADLYFFIKNEL